MKANEEQAFKSIVRQWDGGEHRLAGARASELLYGAGNKLNEKLFDELREKIPGIERYISAPAGGAVVETVSDQGGDPLAVQPENRKEATGASNLSSEAAKDQQDKIDKKLEPGRKARAKAAGSASADKKGKGPAGDIVSTKLNPDPQNPTEA
ncbi:hypothetical protein MK632_13785 [Rhizobium changzhiense]|uniref:hypothetical protein n=1 Tax=Rhizobium changzhiense TaxID=2692317 RepID=UPI001F0BC035|nr:hypothetical protein [Rhizobium changzhiense]MCH4546846.1 hypothetical protein [Rhizobium changzhiense]